MSQKANIKRDEFLRALQSGPVIMGILNLTPDSFSDGGQFNNLKSAVAQARLMSDQGAAIIDIGAESTRPDFTPVSAHDEWERIKNILPAIEELSVPLSIDTHKSEVASRALGLGVAVVNDIWGLQGDKAMAEVVAENNAAVVIMHNRQEKDEKINIVDDIKRFFELSLSIADRAGIPSKHIILDPGIGFGKTQAQNFQALQATPLLVDLGFPVLIGVSRKSLFSKIGGFSTNQRLAPSLAAAVCCYEMGASIFRVHDVEATRMALATARAVTSPNLT